MILKRNILIALILSQTFQWLLSQEQLTVRYYEGDYPYVIRSASNLIQEGDTAFNTFYLKALAESQQGQTMEAITTLQLALSVHPNDLRFSRMLARQYFEAGDYVQAQRGYDALVGSDSTDVSSWLKLAEIASFRQAYEEAVDALNQVLLIDSMNLSSLMMMGDILNRHNKEEAIEYYERAYYHYPENQKAAYALANLFILSKDAWKAIPICEQILVDDTTSIKFSKLLGYAYYKTGQPESAVRYLEYTNQLGDSTAFTFKFKGISHYLRVDFNSAIQALRFALKKDTLDAEIYFFLGASMATTREKAEAMQHLDRSLKLMQPDPTVASRIYSEQGNIMRLEEEYDKAYALYEQAWDVDSTNVISLYYMASILDNSLHQSEKALYDYQRYIEALDSLPEKKQSNQGISIRTIVEDRIVSLKEELFFRDEQ